VYALVDFDTDLKFYPITDVEPAVEMARKTVDHVT